MCKVPLGGDEMRLGVGGVVVWMDERSLNTRCFPYGLYVIQ